MSKSLHLSFAALAANSLLALSAFAQAPTQDIRGRVVSVTSDTLVVSSQGRSISLSLASDWMIAVSAPSTLSAIKPGSFVGTTNADVADGGLASEVHIFPPGSKLGEGQRVMEGKTKMTNGTVKDATVTTNGTVEATTRMTNGGVQKVNTDAGETVLELTFPEGTRRVRVPANATITSFTPVDRATLKPGILVSARAQAVANGLVVRFVMTGPNGTAPAR